ncbi:hypothetical protein KAFR_0K00400 [Kazachstania africana CBS 2517]|uniref:FMR1-interacting protein 1 conserved domain-containing protein n=1 Tax=Kazachstania africana (strain ATCC 22294 / BCRC 22015 / CBS 2517 / CECT 1963 / NBRC 1671 / NRRL Y-8276) TaxID=1071382 RepID=H2B195_KAZAF|nr:hypothetical protein KAFR_0K00400 [Kazachstania africana CBS 2517]CCF60395.1 hypothetical protein KAFR_0K00400 [Kazachstania africana CBS 2517]
MGSGERRSNFNGLPYQNSLPRPTSSGTLNNGEEQIFTKRQKLNDTKSYYPNNGHHTAMNYATPQSLDAQNYNAIYASYQGAPPYMNYGLSKMYQPPAHQPMQGNGSVMQNQSNRSSYAPSKWKSKPLNYGQDFNESQPVQNGSERYNGGQHLPVHERISYEDIYSSPPKPSKRAKPKVSRVQKVSHGSKDKKEFRVVNVSSKPTTSNEKPREGLHGDDKENEDEKENGDVNEDSNEDDDNGDDDDDDDDNDSDKNIAISGTAITLVTEEDIKKWREERRKMWLLKISNNKKMHMDKLGISEQEVNNTSVLKDTKKQKQFVQNIQNQVRRYNPKANLGLKIVQREMANDNTKILKFIEELGEAGILDHELTQAEKEVLFGGSNDKERAGHYSGNNINNNRNRPGNYEYNGHDRKFSGSRFNNNYKSDKK